MWKIGKRGIAVLMALILGPVALVVLFIGFGEISFYAYYANKPILWALRSAPGLQSWVDNSGPAKQALLQKFPLGSDASQVITALSAEGFKCHSEGAGNFSVCYFEDSGSIGMRTRWGLRLRADGARRLTDVQIDLQTVSL
jgi:hypothetical protein